MIINWKVNLTVWTERYKTFGEKNNKKNISGAIKNRTFRRWNIFSQYFLNNFKHITNFPIPTKLLHIIHWNIESLNEKFPQFDENLKLSIFRTQMKHHIYILRDFRFIQWMVHFANAMIVEYLRLNGSKNLFMKFIHEKLANLSFSLFSFPFNAWL